MTDTRKTGSELTCVPLQESDRRRFTVRMSPGGRKISEEIKWNERGFVPSFAVTDKILMVAARRVYTIPGVSDR
ncbi:hypothetical protein Mpal_0890 [Methanosphaerula palustris E1-9c]|uniref:Uncharacterized protein n=1 Tax=Methanosphaerula palustris (strain ATCC BAA-1556 / DSM 19958 / E1-9c) TaxID=521011 RepID=B8GGJ3_METPE|nr:hypothetical protein Mpal_0890 [Methanosphaerula palustris E1-9c]